MIPLMIIALLVAGAASAVYGDHCFRSSNPDQRDFAVLPAMFGFLMIVGGFALMIGMVCVEIAKRSLPIA